jgi:hypothetical protein
MPRYMSDHALMNSDYKTRVAAFLQVNGANEHTGITAKTITDELELTGNIVYRILKMTGFHQSQLPKWPRGHYYDVSKSIAQSIDKFASADKVERVADAAVRTITEHKTMVDNMTPVGKLLSQVFINPAIDKDLVEKSKSLKYVYTRQEIIDNLKNVSSDEGFAAFLVVGIIAYSKGLIKRNVPVVESFSFDANDSAGNDKTDAHQ